MMDTRGLLSELLLEIDPAWRAAFVRFVETGEADPAFTQYVRTDKKCRDAIEKLLSSKLEMIAPLIDRSKQAPR